MKAKGRQVVLALVFLVLGFLIAFSYNVTEKTSNESIQFEGWNQEYELREDLIAQEEKNRELQQQIISIQEEITNIENSLADDEEISLELAEEAEKYRMYIGKVKVEGPGVMVTLADGEYDANQYNINDYIVHEHHVFKVINELYVSGAEAVAINGQRLNHDSYIVCNGPVITVDGKQHPAPFIISAIGESEVLEKSLLLAGGIRDQLVNENIIFSIEKKAKIQLEPFISS